MKLTATLAGLLVAAMPILATAQPLTMVLSNDNNAKGLKGQTFDFFVERAKEALGDDLTADMHHGGTLFDQDSQVVGTQLGEAQIIAPAIGIYSQLVPEVNMFELPFLLSSPAKIQAAFEDESLRALWVPKLQAKGIEPVAIWMNGPRDLGYRGDKPVLLPEDAQGLKIRVQSAPVYVAPFEAIHSNPVGVSWSETPTALEQGVIDGAEPTPNAWRGSGMWQMIDQITLTEHIYTAWIVGANKMWWDGLTDAQREGLQSALDAATAWNAEQADQINNQDLEFFASEGKQIHRLTEEQQAAWKDAMVPVWQKYGTEVIGEDGMNRLIEISKAE
ncbi:TRAP transporter substrate-binding protein [Salipiger mangrovisoli]|uniref:TRAP transporter substrate-binding protein n=1 Tax=Salipiger mangrovisoli TaxID=2865933 RepID=A0ABR9X7S3_9RHOB|nr:TRAP transporter substrate-binding protein [Salipiger mangrovisoli]MBE9639621.1 TRAP transporter substrate-binding protein [Salipiger mangrovisoli]